MHFFYSNQINDDQLTLDEHESRHCVKVMRKKRGDLIQVLDGMGGLYRCELNDVTGTNLTLSIIDKSFSKPLKSYQLNVAIAPTKNISRYEWFLEKAVELGINEIFPITTQHSERRVIKQPRIKKILLSAMKQSADKYLPIHHDILSLDKFIKMTATSDKRKFLAYLGEQSPEFSHTYVKGQNVLMVIGPEGGFSKDEALKMRENGFEWVSLGPTRLRTETAGIFVCAALRTINS